ncbi:uncharacterized protein Z520_04642 [Fonsecaea multimorphosa CBS 102226]|uniref:Fe2OG dioxygenase domain-containing protein n=1 Tax=Fonsecaea multimorphosa CBS 102226 TaxID=1442371 RepID=A0A0D2KA30_9EURO|nr:uncharacterized protein Z520_04642 [Fonsecaea multimorphosa CBS 102226]KIY00005.1 hypothetical protein Z520_04642 [Fonsecaea multimorphosa CBS 102226]OAL26216.1 hypothetical protein AYO22_04394 [Fonsecaea multimorphosa]
MASFVPGPELVEQFHRDGFLVLRAEEHGLVKPEQLQAWTREVREWPTEKGKWMPYHEVNTDGTRQLMRTENFVDYHPEFHALLCGEALAKILKSISGDDMLLFKDKINYKLRSGNGFAAHLDAPAYDHIGKIEHLTANFAVDEANAENGCIEVVPGSHKMDVELSHGGAISKSWEDSHEWTKVPLRSGDILLFGSHLAHRSAPNRTNSNRSSIYATYHGKSDGLDLRQRYYKHRRENFPPDHERVAGKDYSQGYKTYGFAAPFMSEKQVEQDKARVQPVH